MFGIALVHMAFETSQGVVAEIHLVVEVAGAPSTSYLEDLLIGAFYCDLACLFLDVLVVSFLLI